MVRPAPASRHHVVYLEQLEREVSPAASAEALLPTVEDVLVLAVGDRRIYVGAPRDVGAGGDVPVVEEVAHRLPEAHVDQLHGFRGDVDAHPFPAQLVRRDAGGGAASERVKNPVPFVGTGFDDALK